MRRHKTGPTLPGGNLQACRNQICFFYLFFYEFFPHARTHGDPLQHSLFELAVDGQHLGVADKGEGQDGDSVGRLWKLIKKNKSVRQQLQTGFLSLKPHIPHLLANTDVP